MTGAHRPPRNAKYTNRSLAAYGMEAEKIILICGKLRLRVLLEHCKRKVLSHVSPDRQRPHLRGKKRKKDPLLTSLEVLGRWKTHMSRRGLGDLEPVSGERTHEVTVS